MPKNKQRLKPRQPERGKHIAPHPPETDLNTLPPILSLEHLDNGHYCITQCSQEQQAALATQLYNLSQIPWGEIIRTHRHGLGSEKIARGSIRSTIPSHITEDRTSFLAIRFHGKAPMVGYRDGRIFYILWLDHDFSLYDHGS